MAEARAAQPLTRDLSPQLLVTSPLRRATQTLLLAFGRSVAEGVPVVAHELCREAFRGPDPSIYDSRSGMSGGGVQPSGNSSKCRSSIGGTGGGREWRESPRALEPGVSGSHFECVWRELSTGCRLLGSSTRLWPESGRSKLGVDPSSVFLAQMLAVGYVPCQPADRVVPSKVDPTATNGTSSGAEL